MKVLIDKMLRSYTIGYVRISLIGEEDSLRSNLIMNNKLYRIRVVNTDISRENICKQCSLMFIGSYGHKLCKGSVDDPAYTLCNLVKHRLKIKDRRVIFIPLRIKEVSLIECMLYNKLLRIWRY